MLFKTKKSNEQKSNYAKDIDKIRVEEERKHIRNVRKKAKKVKKKNDVAKNVIDTIPYIRFVDEHEGIIEVEKNKYSKTYEFMDINYSTADDETQTNIFLAYCKLLNSFDTAIDVQISIHNNLINSKEFERQMLEMYEIRQNDEYNGLVYEIREILNQALEKGQKGIQHDKYITLSLYATSSETAKERFFNIEADLIASFDKIGSHIKVCDANKRIRTLTDIFRSVNVEIPTFDYVELKKKYEKSYIAPDYFEFKDKYFMYNNKYAIGMFIKNLPKSIHDNILTEVVSSNIDMIFTQNLMPIETAQAIRMIQNQITSIKSNMISKNKKAVQDGISGVDITSEEVKRELAELQELYQDMTSSNQKMFMNNYIIMVTGESYEEVIDHVETIQRILRKHVVDTSVLAYMQEEAMISALPLGNNVINANPRHLTTESTAVFLPFNSLELKQTGGLYYGRNAISQNLVVLNRLSLNNPNGFVLGSPGSGKSFISKFEMMNVFLTQVRQGKADIIILDPEREYSELVKKMHGETIVVSEYSQSYINPFDIPDHYFEETDSPYKMKSDFLLTFYTTLFEVTHLDRTEKSILNTCSKKIYQKFFKTRNKADLPTLFDLYEALQSESEPVAHNLALQLDFYTSGGMDLFSHQTNVDTSNSVLSFDIKDLGKQYKIQAMTIIMDYIWSRVAENRNKGKLTYIYLDEFYLMFGNEVTAQFFQELYKRARKYGGVPTGITQNVEDLLKSYTARTMLSNSEFLIMMKQSMSDRRELVELRHLSKTEAQYFTSVTAGQGVIDFGGIIIPTDFKIDNDTELYSYLTTKISEVKTVDVVKDIEESIEVSSNDRILESYENAFEKDDEEND